MDGFQQCRVPGGGDPRDHVGDVRGQRDEQPGTAVFDGGDILDPNNGKVYRVKLTLIDGGAKLDVRGYIGTPMLGRTHCGTNSSSATAPAVQAAQVIGSAPETRSAGFCATTASA